MTDKPMALKFPIELKFRNVDFCGGRKTWEPGEKPSDQEENQQQTQPTYDTGSGIKPRPHWWEASAITTAPSLLTVQTSLWNLKVLF